MAFYENYGTRKCLVCGNEFEARYMSHVVCSDTCRITRSVNQKRESRERRDLENKRLKYALQNYACEIEFYETELSHIFNALKNDESRPQKRQIENEVIDKDLSIQDKDFLYCDRMKLKAFSLPCGQREECWGGIPCDKTSGMDKSTTLVVQKDSGTFSVKAKKRGAAVHAGDKE